jgi:hypothetical protein
MYLRHEPGVSPRFTTRLRISAAQRPWIRWLLIAGLALAVGATVAAQFERMEQARTSWGETVTVFIARRDLAPGEPLAIEKVELPAVAVPASALSTLPADATARQRIATGEVVVAGDVTEGVGPAGRAARGTVVVAVRDPLVVTAPLGARVAVFADGIVLAASAEVVHLDADVVYVAVAESEGPTVAAAAQQQAASIVFLA